MRWRTAHKGTASRVRVIIIMSVVGVMVCWFQMLEDSIYDIASMNRAWFLFVLIFVKIIEHLFGLVAMDSQLPSQQSVGYL